MANKSVFKAKSFFALIGKHGVSGSSWFFGTNELIWKSACSFHAGVNRVHCLYTLPFFFEDFFLMRQKIHLSQSSYLIRWRQHENDPSVVSNTQFHSLANTQANEPSNLLIVYILKQKSSAFSHNVFLTIQNNLIPTFSADTKLFFKERMSANMKLSY